MVNVSHISNEVPSQNIAKLNDRTRNIPDHYSLDLNSSQHTSVSVLTLESTFFQPEKRLLRTKTDVWIEDGGKKEDRIKIKKKSLKRSDQEEEKPHGRQCENRTRSRSSREHITRTDSRRIKELPSLRLLDVDMESSSKGSHSTEKLSDRSNQARNTRSTRSSSTTEVRSMTSGDSSEAEQYMTRMKYDPVSQRTISSSREMTDMQDMENKNSLVANESGRNLWQSFSIPVFIDADIEASNDSRVEVMEQSRGRKPQRHSRTKTSSCRSRGASAEFDDRKSHGETRSRSQNVSRVSPPRCSLSVPQGVPLFATPHDDTTSPNTKSHETNRCSLSNERSPSNHSSKYPDMSRTNCSTSTEPFPCSPATKMIDTMTQYLNSFAVSHAPSEVENAILRMRMALDAITAEQHASPSSLTTRVRSGKREVATPVTMSMDDDSPWRKLQPLRVSLPFSPSIDEQLILGKTNRKDVSTCDVEERNDKKVVRKIVRSLSPCRVSSRRPNNGIHGATQAASCNSLPETPRDNFNLRMEEPHEGLGGEVIQSREKMRSSLRGERQSSFDDMCRTTDEDEIELLRQQLGRDMERLNQKLDKLQQKRQKSRV